MVKSSDWVVLYTKTGRNSEKQVDDGPSSYFFYWHLDAGIWLPGYVPVVVETPNWQIGKIVTEASSGRVAEGA